MFGGVSAYFTGILRALRVREILDVFEGFPWFFLQKTKEKKDREMSHWALWVWKPQKSSGPVTISFSKRQQHLTDPKARFSE